MIAVIFSNVFLTKILWLCLWIILIFVNIIFFIALEYIKNKIQTEILSFINNIYKTDFICTNKLITSEEDSCENDF